MRQQKHSATTIQKFSIVVQIRKYSQPEIVEADCTAKVGDLLDILKNSGLELPNRKTLALFLEDEDEELDEGKSLEAVGLTRRPCVHAGCRAQRIKAIVNFQGNQKERRFGPAKTIGGVIQWALRAFSISDAGAAEYRLELCDSDQSLPDNLHIGCIEDDDRELCFDLLIDSRQQG